MTITLRRYGGGGKPVRESRYLGGWGAFAREFGVVEGTCVRIEHHPEHPARLPVTVTQPVVSQPEMSQPGVSHPGVSQPRVSQPGVSQRVVSQTGQQAGTLTQLLTPPLSAGECADP